MRARARLCAYSARKCVCASSSACVQRAWADVDKELIRRAEAEDWDDGSTALVAVVRHETVILIQVLFLRRAQFVIDMFYPAGERICA
eukprot:6185179-Pleurochrysis_carterae.AAC.5